MSVVLAALSAIRAVFRQLRALGRHRDRLALTVILDRRAEAGVSDTVPRIRRARPEAAQQLVLALRAGFEQRQPARDRSLYAGVVRGLEVEELDLAIAAPVAAVQRLRALEEQRAGDPLAARGDLDDLHLARHRLREPVEEA